MLVALDLIAPGALSEAVARGVEAARYMFHGANTDPLLRANAAEREQLALSQGKWQRSTMSRALQRFASQRRLGSKRCTGRMATARRA